MAGVYDGAVQELIDELGRLPGIGPKSAQRIAFHLLEADDLEVKALIDALMAVKEKVKYCEICGNVTEDEICRICNDPRRLESVICVVEESRDIVAIERAREYRGRYHVLGGVIDPIGGVGPEDLRIRELYARLANGQVQEVILAMNPNVEGEATATYLAVNLAQLGVAVSRLASGLPVGGDLEYADEITISRALEGRQRVHAPGL
ncbi:recombination mediator RecR [Arcanobacterium hippocoleae]|uniref:Recombination protein RecR n=1 Tax=Arcanobacterium hippocoleae TaxID=149017 RepID=A0ABU1T352_9ACTO|nr:recombination mediator RecR [Arcanobacterium hippocoleae]MDR6939798.1 recombination protein RecR [Arcanobacterium hippocoleae]